MIRSQGKGTFCPGRIILLRIGRKSEAEGVNAGYKDFLRVVSE